MPANSGMTLLLKVRQELEAAENVGNVEKAMTPVLSMATHGAASCISDGLSELSERHFFAFCQTVLVDHIATKWLKSMNAEQKERLFCSFYLRGPPCESILSLCAAFKQIQYVLLALFAETAQESQCLTFCFRMCFIV